MNYVSFIKRILLVFPILLISYFAIGCNNLGVSEAQLSKSIDINNKPVGVTNVFQMDDENIYCTFKLNGVNSSTTLTIDCILVETGFSEVPPLIWYHETSLSTLRSGYSNIKIPRRDKFFPSGTSNVVLYLNDIKEIELPFQIEKPNNQDVILSELKESTQDDKNYLNIQYQWIFKGKPFDFTFNLPDSLYKFFQSIDRISTDDPTNYSVYVTNTYDDDIISAIANGLIQLALTNGFNNYDDQLHFILSFVQGLRYVSDNATTPFNEYPKYPIETLVELGGDCEDTSILLASLYRALNIDTVLLLLRSPGHCAVGIAVSGLSGFGVERDGIVYYYIETTNSGQGHRIGEIPQNYIGQVPLVAKLSPISYVQFRQIGKYSPYYVMGNVVQLTVDIINVGSDTAKNVCIVTGFEGDNNQLINEQRTRIFNLSPNYVAEAIFYLDIPSRRGNKLTINILQDGHQIKSSFTDIEAYKTN